MDRTSVSVQIHGLEAKMIICLTHDMVLIEIRKWHNYFVRAHVIGMKRRWICLVREMQELFWAWEFHILTRLIGWLGYIIKMLIILLNLGTKCGKKVIDNRGLMRILMVGRKIGSYRFLQIRWSFSCRIFVRTMSQFDLFCRGGVMQFHLYARQHRCWTPITCLFWLCICFIVLAVYGLFIRYVGGWRCTKLAAE